MKAAEWGHITCLTGVIKSPDWGELLWRFRLQSHQNADEIDSAVESDSQATSVESNLSFSCNNSIEAKSSFIRTNNSSLFVCLLSDQVVAFWTSPCIPGVACDDKYFFTMGRWCTYLSGVPHFHVNRSLELRPLWKWVCATPPKWVLTSTLIIFMGELLPSPSPGHCELKTKEPIRLKALRSKLISVHNKSEQNKTLLVVKVAWLQVTESKFCFTVFRNLASLMYRQ